MDVFGALLGAFCARGAPRTRSCWWLLVLLCLFSHNSPGSLLDCPATCTCSPTDIYCNQPDSSRYFPLRSFQELHTSWSSEDLQNVTAIHIENWTGGQTLNEMDMELYTGLQRLTIMKSNLRTIPTRLFSNNPQLHYINLSKNPMLATLSWQIFHHLQLTELHLEEVVFTCGCELRWLQLWQQRGEVGLSKQQLYCTDGVDKTLLQDMNISNCDLPEISVSHSNLTVVEGDRATVVCNGSGSLLTEVDWLVNSMHSITEQEARVYENTNIHSNKLTLVNVSREDNNFLLTCTASNIVGITNAPVQLTVHYPPVIVKLREPERRHDMCIEFTVRGSPHPTIRWFYKDKELFPSDSVRADMDTYQDYIEGCLHFKNPTHHNNGNYTLEVTNYLGVATSTVHGHFLDEPFYDLPEISVSHSNLTVVEGDRATVVCNGSGSLLTEVDWLVNSMHSITEQEARVYENTNIHSNKLTLVNVSREDNNFLLTCTASNIVGITNAHVQLTVQLTVHYPPVIVKLREPERRHDMCIEFTVRGSPHPTIRWFYKDKELFPSDSVRADMDTYQDYIEGCLHFKNPTHHNNGNYTLEVTNYLGVATSTVHGHFLDKPFYDLPEISVSHSNLTVVEGDRATVVCNGSGSLLPEVDWLVNSMHSITEQEARVYENTNIHSNKLTLVNVSREDNNFLLTCTASNIVGITNAPVQLTVHYPPVIVKLREPERRHDMCIEFIVRGSPHPTIRWFYKDKELFPSDSVRADMDTYLDYIEGCLHFKNPTHHNNGNYTLEVTNYLGVATSTVHGHFLDKPFYGVRWQRLFWRRVGTNKRNPDEAVGGQPHH